MAVSRFSVSPSALVSTAALCFFTTENVFLAAVISIAVHEIGHLAAMSVCGERVESVCIDAFGMSIMCARPMTYKNELFSASSGPFASFLLAAVCLALGRLFPHEGLTLTAGISFVYGVFNCLPVVPFDGGRILRSILMMKMNVDRAEDVLKITDAAGFALLCFGACLIMIVSGYNFLPLLLLSGLLLSRIRKYK